MQQTTLWRFFLQAPFLMKIIFLLLGLFSLISWIVIAQNYFLLRHIQKSYSRFEQKFWSGAALIDLYRHLPEVTSSEDITTIFHVGFTEFLRLRESGCQTISILLEAVERTMHAAHMQAILFMGRYLNVLLIVSLLSPYLGIFCSLFRLLSMLSTSNTAHALSLMTFDITDCLSILLISLFITISTIIFYYRSIYQIDKLSAQYHIFEEEFIALLLRQTYEETQSKSALST